MIDVIMENTGEIELVTLDCDERRNRTTPRAADCSLCETCNHHGWHRGIARKHHAVSRVQLLGDPEAAHIVANSGLHFEMAGWDISTAHAVIHDELADQWRDFGPLGAFAVEIRSICATRVLSKRDTARGLRPP